MSTFIYTPSNNKVVQIPGNGVGVRKSASFKTEGAAKAYVTRSKRKIAKYKLEGKRIPWYLEDFSEWTLIAREDYQAIDTKVEKRCFMTGELFMEDVNTPYNCSRSSETYWSS